MTHPETIAVLSDNDSPHNVGWMRTGTGPYRAICTCGWVADRSHRTRQEAEGDAAAHRAETEAP